MAISDVLFEAADDIREYLKEMPDTYQDYRLRLLALLRNMDKLREELDTPPSVPKHDENADAKHH